ncbi:MAG: hypothetical protein JWP30_1103 [Homoserinimonas sp.]|nr:hypothetical protein [Homoserinimonas sp.]
MLPQMLSQTTNLTELIDHRHEASVTIYLERSPLPGDTEAEKISFKNAAKDAASRLETLGFDKRRIAEATEPLWALSEDEELWQEQNRGLAIFSAPGVLHVFAFPNTVASLVTVGDRFDVGQVLRTVTGPSDAFVLAVSEGGAHLYKISSVGRPVQIPIDLPEDLHTVLEYTTTADRRDRERPLGTTGQKVEQQRFCRIVQDAVLARIGGASLPMVLNATNDLEPAYRAINAYTDLLPVGIEAHPESLKPDELDAQARAILDDHDRAVLSEWRERFGTQRSNGRATSKAQEVAVAASTGAVAELLFTIEAALQGTIDEDGTLHIAEEGSPQTYRLADEIAARVLRSGGTVRAVPNKELVDGSPVAAILRYPLMPTG